MRAPLGSSLGRHLLAAITAISGVVALEGHADAASCIPGFDYAGFGIDDLRFGGGATTNSYDSSLGPYPAGVLSSGSDLGTNGPCPNLGGAGTIGGNVVAGEGTTCGAPTSAQATGAEPVFPAVVIPASIGVARGSCTDCTMDTITGNTWTNVGTTNPSGVTTLAGGTFIVTGDFGTTTGGTINVTAASAVYLTCASGSIDIKGTITTVGNKPANMVIMAGPSCTTITINGGANPAFALYAPNAEVTLNGSGEIFGSIVAKDLKVTGSADIHYDRDLRNLEIGNLRCAIVEISRASPIIATVGTDEVMIQGTYESPIPATSPQVLSAADLLTFEFPYIQGHLRARKISLLTAVQTFNAAGLSMWDGAGIDAGVTPGGIPPVTLLGCASNYTPYCRTVFTNAATGLNPANVVFNTTAATVGSLA